MNNNEELEFRLGKLENKVFWMDIILYVIGGAFFGLVVSLLISS